jgi:hypothetical protein
MQTYIVWTKGILSNTYKIYSNNNIIGKMKDNAFSNKALGELYGKEYIFLTSGFLRQQTKILDIKENKIIGEIHYNTWMNKATLTLNNKTLYWEYDNLWNTKWRIFDSEGTEIKYTCSFISGQIDSNTDDSLLLLSGLFVTNYFWQMTIVVLLAVFIPIFMM